MKRILIFYGTYGGGHLSAAKSIRDYINLNYPDNIVEIVDCIEYVNKFINKVSTGIYTGMAKNVPKMWGKIYRDSNSGILGGISNVANKVMAKKLIKLIVQFEPDLIISVLPFSCNMCAYLKKKKLITCKYATIMTDFVTHNQWLNNIEYSDFVFVSNDSMREELIKRGLSPDRIFTSGIPISPRFSFDFDKEKIFNVFGLHNNKTTVLFFGGGEFGFGKELTEKVFDCLLCNFQDIQIIVVAGKNEKLKLSLENIINKYNRSNNVKILGFTDKVPELMSITDFVISKPGGLTTSEAMAKGIPMFIISALPGQEEGNAIFIEKNNAGYWLKKNDDITLCLKNFLGNLNNMKINCKKIGKKNSTKNICEIILN